MKLECVDPKHQSIICCCTVIEVLGSRLRLNFDGWGSNYDFWINANSFFLHPCGWCEKNGQKLQPPKGICSLKLDTGAKISLFFYSPLFRDSSKDNWMDPCPTKAFSFIGSKCPELDPPVRPSVVKIANRC